ncbi:hypothetical protein DKK68_05270 [Bifidobacterium asteroides]|uniref:hypothetical protein n=1 Tax=Bifidobacterium asteroides TaxID=1684 RepID=UPI000D786333|nr:hypothetical protein [Bifidobacterium asteroides]PXY87185.1 hypothetical protein DKK68_05270 [Bifidobacterium asteroides]
MTLPALRRPTPTRGTTIRLLVTLVVILVLELGVFNLAHWQSLAGSSSNPTAGTTGTIGSRPGQLGPGLSALPGGGLKVTDPAGAWMDVPVSDGQTSFVQAQMVEDVEESLSQIHVRLDLRLAGDKGWTQGTRGLICPGLTRSHYLRIRGNSHEGRIQAMRLWIQEPIGSRLELTGMTPAKVVPFDFNPARILVLVCLAALILGYLPGSVLWRTRLDTCSVNQRLVLALILAPLAAWSCWNIQHDLSTFTPMAYHQPNAYVYDFNQYDHVAQALLHGHPWLDLGQAPGLAKAANPFDIATRNALLAQDQQPIYWDYVYRDGHWYSYFGALPVLLLFLPYRVITSLVHPGGYALPTSSAAALLVAMATIMTALATIRLLNRWFPRVNLAVVGMALMTMLGGSGMVYLWCRRNFYTIPFDASLLAVMSGLWLWMGARRVHRQSAGTGGHSGRRSTRMWTVEDGDRPWQLSRPRLFLGSLSVAATLGCRPTFLAAGLLALPLFDKEIRAVINALFTRGRHPAGLSRRRALSLLVCGLLPVLLIAAPLLWYNRWRFGSLLDFGNRYQMTVLDLTNYHPGTAGLLQIFGYYLLQPLTVLPVFPYLQFSPAPMRVWHFTEPGLGGLLVTTPVLIPALALLALPRIRKELQRRGWIPGLILTLAMATLVMTADSYIGGFSVRYSIDFAWLICLAALVVMAAASSTYDDGRSGAGAAVMSLLTVACLAGLALTFINAMVLLEHFDSSQAMSVAVWFMAP